MPENSSVTCIDHSVRGHVVVEGLGSVDQRATLGVTMEQVRSFRAEPASVRAARMFVVEALVASDADLDVIRLLTSELATNAVLHADSGFLVRVITTLDVVRVEVINSEPELLLAMRQPSETGGRGLPLVAELSSGWGAESRRAEKVVWFEVPASVVADDSQPSRG